MEPLSSSQERKPKKDHSTRKGRTSTSLTPAFGEPSSSHPTNDDEDVDHNEGTSHASIPSPVSYVNSLINQVPQVFQNPPNIDPHLEPFYTRQTEIINRQVQIRDEHRGGVSDEEVTTTPSPITTYSSPSAPNAPSKTTSTKETTSSHEITSSYFQSKLQLSPTPSNEPTSPQTQNHFLQNLMDVPPRPSNPLPIQTISPLDITLSLSPIIPLEIPSSPPLPQPSIMGHPLYYNYHDYHGSTCVCCFNNRNLYLNLRDEMNIMFAHLEYLITTALTTHFPPPP
ncbi:hypothetical protein Tco_0368756 [Tanacetum coccineum]